MNSMDDETLETIVGPGLTKLSLKPFPFRDHKREEAAIKENKPFPDGAPVPIIMGFPGQALRRHRDPFPSQL